MKPTYRADHVGSLIRPQRLLSAREKNREGRLSLEELRKVEDEVISEYLRMQRNAGMPVLSDGELRRDAWMTGFSAAMDGFIDAASTLVWTTLDGKRMEEPSYSKVVGRKLKQQGRIAEAESTFMREHAQRPFKITMPSPLVVARQGFKDGVTTSAYPTRDALLADVLDIMEREIRTLISEGVSYIQLDEGFTSFLGDQWQELARAQGRDPNDVLTEAIAAENRLFDAVDHSKVTTAIHICRGNLRGRWALTGSYDAMAERVFNELHVDRFLLEYDSERAGDFAPLRFIPRGKVGVLGLITTKVPELESEADVLRRIESASRHCALERLALSPQCGFASNPLTEDDQRRKLELTVRVAEKTWTRVDQ